MPTSSGGRHSGAKNADQEARKKGPPPQSEIDRCTHIEKKRYSKAEYQKFTPAQKAKLWQLHNPGMIPGAGNKTSGKSLADLTDSKIAALTTAVSPVVSMISSLFNATAKLADLAASETPDTPGSDDISNRSNPALACQAQCPKATNRMTSCWKKNLRTGHVYLRICVPAKKITALGLISDSISEGPINHQYRIYLRVNHLKLDLPRWLRNQSTVEAGA